MIRNVLGLIAAMLMIGAASAAPASDPSYLGNWARADGKTHIPAGAVGRVGLAPTGKRRLLRRTPETDVHDLRQRPVDRGPALDDVIVAYRNGAPVRVRDIGRAEAGPADTTQAAWSNGKSSVFLVIWKQPGANVIDTVEAIKRALGPLQAAIPHDIQVKVLSDRTLTIRASVRDVEFTLMLTITLVVMVIFVFLRSVWTTV